MIKTISIILITALLILAILFLTYRFLPLKYLEPLSVNQRFGTTLTTILGTDTLSSSRTTINNNFTALNAGKIENSSSSIAAITTLHNLTTADSLAIIGTITNGIWNSTAIGVGYGGTGTTSPAQYLVILGNGAAGITVASSTGTAGQFLTSNGAGAYPSWQTSSLNLTDSYAWTGLHSFAATTTMATTTIQGVIGGLMPAGSIAAYATITPPLGWKLCDGSSLAKTTYPDLFAVIGYYYGGSGASFNLPNLSGRQILMASSSANMGQSGGESLHTQSIAEMPAHTHSLPSGDAGVGQPVGAANPTGSALNTGSAGSGTAFNVLDPYFVLYYICKY